jgi:monofunctional glycosyltransferase
MAGGDARFCRHHGFDWGAIATAWDRYQSGHLGAGTISIQTAKNFFLWPGRDWLAIYLNVAEWGRGDYGAEAAARHYFHKPVDALDLSFLSRRSANPRDSSHWTLRWRGQSRANPSPNPNSLLVLHRLRRPAGDETGARLG